MDMSTSKEWKSASYSSGYSTSNAHAYKNNRINEVGSYCPFLMERDLLQLPAEIRRRIAILICVTVKLVGTENRYVGTSDDKNAGSPWLKMRIEFWEMLGMTMEGDDANLFQYFFAKVFPSSANSCFNFTKIRKMIPPLLTEEHTLSRHLLS